MTFSDALEALKQGHRVTRQGSNGAGMWLSVVSFADPPDHAFTLHPCIAMKTTSNVLQPGWTPSQADMFADDWAVYLDPDNDLSPAPAPDA